MSIVPGKFDIRDIPEIKEYLDSFWPNNKPIADDGTKLNGLSIDELYKLARDWKTKQNKKS